MTELDREGDQCREKAGRCGTVATVVSQSMSMNLTGGGIKRQTILSVWSGYIQNVA